ncbi:DUF1178 family protein [Parvularcula sp. IMCC14364]|uniref:DUF1178 family protein n=1 Tax=Parvularcula sp. IMCC14364 TaxID=3067902 RepID=UPI0027404A08|nr:DUF1178 family protein [Parvularcula sp. IMCC14364]
MIKYQLKCPDTHEFEGWFRNSQDFEDQAGQSLLECPVCGSSQISKALMAPALARTSAIATSSDKEEKIAAYKRDLNDAARKAKTYIEKNFDDVGKRFPEEARKIHYGETEQRSIYGEATPTEVKELVEEGVEIAPVPQPEPETSEVKKKLN